MSNTLADLKKQAAELSEAERAELALALIESRDAPAETGVDVEEAWRVEIEHRAVQVERKEVQLIPGDEVFQRLRRRLG